MPVPHWRAAVVGSGRSPAVIAANATLPRLRPGDYRRVNLKVFPYYIAYALRDDSAVVLAIAHAHRQPEYWIGRQSAGGTRQN